MSEVAFKKLVHILNHEYYLVIWEWFGIFPSFIFYFYKCKFKKNLAKINKYRDRQRRLTVVNMQNGVNETIIIIISCMSFYVWTTIDLLLPTPLYEDIKGFDKTKSLSSRVKNHLICLEIIFMFYEMTTWLGLPWLLLEEKIWKLPGLQSNFYVVIRSFAKKAFVKTYEMTANYLCILVLTLRYFLK